MKITTSSTTFAGRLAALAKVFGNKNAMPILDCYLFELSGNTLTITASDGENVMTTQMEVAEADGEGTFAVSNRIILDAVKDLPEQPLMLEVDLDTHAVKMEYLNGVCHFTAQDGAEFPHLKPMSSAAATVTVDAKKLYGDITRAVFATGDEELRPVMNGVYFDLTADHLAVVASDGHKLVRSRNHTVKSDVPKAFIMPRKPAVLLKNALQKAEGEAVITFDEKNATITYSDGTLSCLLIGGRYPNYNSVIPQDNPNILTVDRQQLTTMVKRVLPFANDSAEQVRMHVEMGRLVVSSEDIDFSMSAKVETTCDYNGTVMDIGFKGPSLVDILSNLEGETVVLELADPSRPCLIIPSEQPQDEDVLMLIMPMLLND